MIVGCNFSFNIKRINILFHHILLSGETGQPFGGEVAENGRKPPDGAFGTDGRKKTEAAASVVGNLREDGGDVLPRGGGNEVMNPRGKVERRFIHAPVDHELNGRGFAQRIFEHVQAVFKAQFRGAVACTGRTAAFAAVAVRGFRGVERRFDFKWKTPNKAVLSDYAHHPAEIEQSIRSVHELYAGRKLTVAFQPHLYTRTRDFYREFAKSLSLADEVILTDIYPAREAPIPGVSSELIYDLLRPGIEKHLCRKEEVAGLVERENTEVLIILGAGDLDNYAADIARRLAAKG